MARYGNVGSGRRRGRGSSLLEGEVLVVREVAKVRRQRAALEIRQRAPDRSGVPGLHRPGEGPPPGPMMTVQATSSSATSMSIADWGAASVAAARSTSKGAAAVDHDVAQVEPAVRDVGVVQSSHLLPEVVEHVVAHRIGARTLQRVEIKAVA